MSTVPEATPPVLNAAAAPERTLRRLFLTLFLRGRSSRGLRLNSAPKSLGEKLALVLFFYAAFGFFALFFLRQPVFALAVYLHSMTFVFLGMFVASSAGEILFNKEEADILLHRPVSARDLLWSKIRVLIEVSLWLAGAFNIVGCFAGLAASDGGPLFPLVHVISTALEAVFCTGCVVLVYQVCLRWFGRERLEGLMTTAQVLVAVASVLAGQILPRVVLKIGGVVRFSAKSWWIGILPPAWFAGIDDALAGSYAKTSWLLAGFAVAATALVLWFAFGRLARDYESGLQALGETVSRPRVRSKRHWLGILVNVPPFKWCFRTPVSRAAFLLTLAYLFRDRDVKLRVYPGLAPMLVMPFILLIEDRDKFGFAFCAAFIAVMPMMALNLLQYSQQWQAADIFRVAPMSGPAELCHGARHAVLWVLTIPLLLLIAAAVWLLQRDASRLVLFLPSIIAMPVAALVPSILRTGVPLSVPAEEAKSVGRGLQMILIMLFSAALAGIGIWAFSQGWFMWLLLVELPLAGLTYLVLRIIISKLKWEPLD
jgi:ABC-2 type transport system permease protein